MMLLSAFIRSTCRADIDGLDHLADRSVNKKLLQELLGSSVIVSQADEGTIWHRENAKTGVFYYVSHKAPETIGLYIGYREIVLTPGLLALEVCSWQSTLLGGSGRGWQVARDEVFGILLGRSQLLVSSDRLRDGSGARFWEDRVAHHILAGGRGGSVLDGELVYQHDYSWFAPKHLGRDGRSRFFLQARQQGT